MKNIITLIAICFVAINANAQKVTQKMLEGKWMVIQLTMDGNVFDIKNNTVKLTPEYLAGFKKKTPDEANAYMVKQMNKEMTGNYFQFIGNVFEMKFLADTIDTEKYEVKESNGKYFITSPSDEFEVRIEGRLLHAGTSADGRELKLILEKQQL